MPALSESLPGGMCFRKLDPVHRHPFNLQIRERQQKILHRAGAAAGSPQSLP